MRVAFAGTPEFARAALEPLHAAGHDIVLVLTQPDRPAGRGLKLQASPVKQSALDHGWVLAQPRSLRLDGKFPDEARAAQSALLAAAPDVMVVAAYGLILPQWVLDLPRLGCLNIHASLLPRWRGAAPIHRAIEAGDAHTGVTIMQMDAGLDTGAMLLWDQVPIASDDTTSSLHDKLTHLGADLIVAAVHGMALTQQRLPAHAQPEAGITYANKIEKSEATLDWRQDARTLERKVRAFNPFPGAHTQYQGESIKVWAAQAVALTHTATLGTVLAADAAGVVVAAHDSVLRLTELQRPGGKRLNAQAFLSGFALPVGALLGGA